LAIWVNYTLALTDKLIEGFFANPLPPGVPQHYGGSQNITRPLNPRLSEVAPAVLAAVLNFFMLELDMASQQAPEAGMWMGLRRVLWRGWVLPEEGFHIQPARKGDVERLRIVVYCYTLPISLVVPMYELYDIIETTAQIYGLEEPLCKGLGRAVLSRLCRNVLAS
jgi:hypothetical protein